MIFAQIKCILIIFFLILITGCASSDYYKNEITQVPCIENTNKSCLRKNLVKTDDYTLGFIEIDEQGNLYNKAQVDYILNYLEKSDKQKYVTLYVHGWHHNANDGDENVEQFKNRLKVTKLRHPNMDVTGVYIGWRGESITIPIVNLLTFWDRKAVSEEVGRNSLVDVFSQLEMAVKGGNNSKNVLLTVGHSFGSSVVFNALNQIILQRLVQSKDGESRLGFGDLVVLVNPAFEAMRLTPIIEAAQRYLFKENQKPLMLITTSESDYATKIAFPIARAFNVFFEKHRFFTPTNRDKNSSYTTISEWDLDTTTIGHFDNYITHRLEANKSSGENYTCPTNYGWLLAAVERQQKIQIENDELPTGEGWDTGYSGSKLISPLFNDPSQMQLRHLRKSSAYNPYWVIQTHENVIPDHSSITQKHFWCFVDLAMESVLKTAPLNK